MEAAVLIIVLILSVVIHEVPHGAVANMLGDPTARLDGRLTLNPLVHIDPLGSVILPGLLVLTGAPFLFGWAKPVPYNPYNLRAGRFSEAYVAAAGPMVNILLAVVFAIFVRIGSVLGMSAELLQLGFMVVLINIMLALFNLIPIPPLDGSKILASILPAGVSHAYERFRFQLEHNLVLGFGAIILFILLFGNVVAGAIYGVARLLAGM